MYPTLSHFIYDVFGVKIPMPIQTYGLFVAFAYLTAGVFIMLELKRYEKLNILKVIKKKILVGMPATIYELAGSAFFGFIIGFKFVDAAFNYSQFVQNPQDFILSWTGNWFGGVAGAAISGYMLYREKNKEKLEKPQWVEKEIHPYEMTGNVLLWAAVFGLLGAKLFHNLENFDELIADPIGALLSFSGLSFYGGLVVGLICVGIYVQRNGIPFIRMIDLSAPAMALGYGIGRMGCHLSGDGCWGKVNLAPKPEWLSWLPDWMWAYNFPHNVVHEGVQIPDCQDVLSNKFCHVLENPVFPTSFYEFTIMFLIFIILWSIRKHIKITGLLFSIYLVLEGTERFVIELVRVNPPYHFIGLSFTQAQFISSASILIGIIGIFVSIKWREKFKNI